MATINNSSIIKDVIDKAKIETAFENPPTQLAEKIVPVLAVESEKIIKISTATVSDAASGGIFTTSATRRTFIIGCGLSVTKDVNSTSVHSRIVGTFRNATASGTLLELRYEPTTAGQIAQYLSFTKPIETAKNVSIFITNSTAVASIDTTGVVYYYEEDV